MSQKERGMLLERGLPSESVALLGSLSMSDSMSDDESELIRRPPKPRTGKGGELLLHELSRLVSQCKANSAWNLLKPPGEKSKEEKMQPDIRWHVDLLPWHSPVCIGGSVLHPRELREKEGKKCHTLMQTD